MTYADGKAHHGLRGLDEHMGDATHEWLNHGAGCS